MKHINKRQLFEQVIYLVIWSIVFLAPLIAGYASSFSLMRTFNWHAIRMGWFLMLPFFLLFLINNYYLLPKLLLQKKHVTYTWVLVAIIALLFWIYPSVKHPHDKRFPEHESVSMQSFPHRDRVPRMDMPYPWPGPLFGYCSLALLVVGLNIAIKLMFKSIQDEEAMSELEHQRLQSELQYLKYQINPHFFMNTLNNIHALVDMDAGKAKRSIVEFSKLMRYVLYEASNKTILLSREMQFLDNYMALMRLRYTDKVGIVVSMPDEVPEVEIPPLLFVSFVENAFKHGVSYQNDSFIHVSMLLEEGMLVFHCSNSSWGKSDEQHHGIGLDNIRKRLRLLFGRDYTLSINERTDSFDVLLIIPVL